MKRTKLEKEILSFIPHGRENAIHMKTIVDTFNVSNRVVTDIIRNARLRNEWICSSHKEGYWYTTDIDELRECVGFLDEELNSRQITSDALWNIINGYR